MHIFVDVDGRIRETSTKFIFVRTNDVKRPEFRPTLQHFLSHFRDGNDDDEDDVVFFLSSYASSNWKMTTRR